MPFLIKVAVALIYKITAAVVEPVSDAKTAAILDNECPYLLMLAALASVGLMFLIMISIVAGMSNGLVFARAGRTDMQLLHEIVRMSVIIILTSLELLLPEEE